MSDDKNAPKLEGHSYDGIDELDNSLPRWWINLFYLTVIFSFGYFFYYVIGEGPTLLKEYEHAKTEYENTQYSMKSSVKVASEAELSAFLKDKGRVKAGHEIFEAKCVSCHGAHGEGGIGPNLTDNFWLHGNKMSELLAVVTSGVLDKGMPPWGPILKQDELYSVVTFVKTLGGSRPAGAKAPQGVQVKE